MKKGFLTGLAFLLSMGCDSLLGPEPKQESIAPPDTVYVFNDTTNSFSRYSFSLNIDLVVYEMNETWGVIASGEIYNEGLDSLQIIPNLKLYQGVENLIANIWFSNTNGHLGGGPDYQNYILTNPTEILPALSSLYYVTFSDTIDWNQTDIHYRIGFNQSSLGKGINKTLEGKVEKFKFLRGPISNI